jgi:hypothetical protein
MSKNGLPKWKPKMSKNGFPQWTFQMLKQMAKNGSLLLPLKGFAGVAE